MEVRDGLFQNENSLANVLRFSSPRKSVMPKLAMVRSRTNYCVLCVFEERRRGRGGRGEEAGEINDTISINLMSTCLNPRPSVDGFRYTTG